nr:MAG TPA: hypothetical protein [Caudoviricetes sp.]
MRTRWEHLWKAFRTPIRVSQNKIIQCWIT